MLIIDLAICGFFPADFRLQLAATHNKRLYMQWRWLDLIASIPMFDPFRFARVL